MEDVERSSEFYLAIEKIQFCCPQAKVDAMYLLRGIHNGKPEYMDIPMRTWIERELLKRHYLLAPNPFLADAAIESLIQPVTESQ
jgi:hypothetical protein